MGHKPDYIHNHAYGTLTTDRITRELAVEYGVMCSVGLNDRPEVKQMGMGWYKWGGPEEQLTEDPLGYITSDHDGFLTSGCEYGYLVSHCGYADADLFRLTSFTTCRPMDLDCMVNPKLRTWLDENGKTITKVTLAGAQIRWEGQSYNLGIGVDLSVVTDVLETIPGIKK